MSARARRQSRAAGLCIALSATTYLGCIKGPYAEPREEEYPTADAAHEAIRALDAAIVGDGLASDAIEDSTDAAGENEPPVQGDASMSQADTVDTGGETDAPLETADAAPSPGDAVVRNEADLADAPAGDVDGIPRDAIGDDPQHSDARRVEPADAMQDASQVPPGADAAVDSCSPAPEVCNGIDDDCNGAIDDGLGSITCGVGACSVTVPTCVAGAPAICSPKAPTAEVCNGIDDDCNAAIDDGLGSVTCGVGACSVTVPTCVAGAPAICSPKAPTVEVCGNLIDDDCNGIVDDRVWPNCPTTQQQLNEFFTAHGGRVAFEPRVVADLEALLFAEDELADGAYTSTKTRILDIVSAQPWADYYSWYVLPTPAGTNLDTPPSYAGLRMADYIASRGQAGFSPSPTTLNMTVLLATCATGARPTSFDFSTGESVSLTLDPQLSAENFRMVRQSLRLFQLYIRAITDGKAVLNLTFHSLPGCVTVGYQAPSVVGLTDVLSTVAMAPQAVRDGSDMFWVLYPSNAPPIQTFQPGGVFEGKEYISGGMSTDVYTPVFVVDDRWLTHKPPALGSGGYTDAERRAYLPHWLWHEFSHYLYWRYPEFALEPSPHSWFNGASWPADFVGYLEADYFDEATKKRLHEASTLLSPEAALHVRLRNAAPTPSLVAGLSPQEIVGVYERRSGMQNTWHHWTIGYSAGQYTFTNCDPYTWNVSYASGGFADSPAGPVTLHYARDAAGAYTGQVAGFYLNNYHYEIYEKVNASTPCPTSY